LPILTRYLPQAARSGKAELCVRPTPGPIPEFNPMKAAKHERLLRKFAFFISMYFLM